MKRVAPSRTIVAKLLCGLALVTTIASAVRAQLPPGPVWSATNLSLWNNLILTIPANLDNMPVGQKYWFTNYACNTAPSCVGPATFEATARVKLKRLDGGSTSTLMTNTVSQTPCTCLWTSYDDGSGVYDGNWFILDPCLAPGKYEFFRTYSWATPATSTGSDGTETERLTLSITIPAVVDLAVTNFDVLNETSLCQDGNFQSRMIVKNYGELDASNVVVELWMASNEEMTTDVVLVGSYDYGFLAGGDVDNEVVLEYPLPSFTGKKYFAAKIRDLVVADSPTCGPYNANGNDTAGNSGEWGPNRSNSDAVKQYVDVDFVENGLIWLLPSGSPAKMCYSETYRFKVVYQNKGELPSLPTTAVEVQIRSEVSEWITLETIPIGIVECNSGPLESPERNGQELCPVT